MMSTWIDLLQRIGDSRLVLLGEASHGTAEFYDMRARITRELIEKKGFNIIAAEADWPDAAHIDHYIHGSARPIARKHTLFTFPTWMWANHSVLKFVHWLKAHNEKIANPADAGGFLWPGSVQPVQFHRSCSELPGRSRS